MSRICQVTGKRPMFGNNVSHANNKTKAIRSILSNEFIAGDNNVIEIV